MYSLTPSALELTDYMDDGEDTRHFSFRLLGNPTIAMPTPGQFFMLHVPGVGAAPFTFTVPPDDRGRFRALIRRVGTLTNALFECQPGRLLGFRGPFGRGWPVRELLGQRTLVIAGGCGLAPLSSLLDQMIEQRHDASLTLIYGSRNVGTQMLNPERQRWRQAINVIDVLEDQAGTPLDILPTVFATLAQRPDKALLCGPEAMMTAAAGALVERGLSPDSIWLSLERRMHCAVGSCGHCYQEHHYICKNGPTYPWTELEFVNTNNA